MSESLSDECLNRPSSWSLPTRKIAAAEIRSLRAKLQAVRQKFIEIEHCLTLRASHKRAVQEAYEIAERAEKELQAELGKPVDQMDAERST